MEVFNHSIWLLISYQSLGFFIYAIYLYFHEQKNLSRLFFGFYMLSFSVNIFLVHINLFPHNRNLMMLFPLIFTTSFTLIPLFYLLLKSQLVLNYQFNASENRHFFPILVSFIALLPFWILITSNNPEYLDLIYGIFLLKNWPGHLTFLIENGMLTLIVLQLIYYTYRTIILLRKIEQRISAENCFQTQHILKGLKLFSISFFMLIVLLIFRKNFHHIGHDISSMLYVLALLTLNIGHAYFGIKMTDRSFSSCLIITNHKSKIEKDNVFHRNEPAERYENSCLCDELKKDIVARLENIMNKSESYLNPDLRIEQLALELDTNSKYLSQVINETYNKNFYNYLNDYRCRKVIQRFNDKTFDRYSLDGIAQSCGFRSRSSFVSAFKKYTGRLPSEYRKKNDPSTNG
jgi:AraC-like DNA-binding protein